MRIAVFGNISPDRNPQFEKYIFSVCEAIKNTLSIFICLINFFILFRPVYRIKYVPYVYFLM